MQKRGDMNRFQVFLTQGIAAVLLHCIGSILIRWCVALGPYSGKGKAPMFGDYEAQRHWQEITYNLPVDTWYKNSSQNNLLYWGLDYPPLTAYHSWICGLFAFCINPNWVTLEESRGTESQQHKLFMRYTVLLADVAIFYSSLLALRHVSKKDAKGGYTSASHLLLTLFYPGIILIDHGHFQYNSISLGFFIWAVVAFECSCDLIGSVAFSLALNYKQMELYHALPIFFFLLGKSMKQSWVNCIGKITGLGITVIFTFGVLWAPFLTDVESLLTVIQRLFPLNRGLYEDKVLKFREIFHQDSLVKLCACTTLILSIPASLHTFVYPSYRNLKFSLVNVSLIFFLFSYQVHEKSILIPAVSACLLYDDVPRILISWFLFLTTFSMSPLLMKDGLILQLFSTSIIFFILCFFYHGFSLKSISMMCRSIGITNKFLRKTFENVVVILFWSSIAASTALVVMMNTLNPPERYPDIFSVVISMLSCICFLTFSLVFHRLQFLGANEQKKIE